MGEERERLPGVGIAHPGDKGKLLLGRIARRLVESLFDPLPVGVVEGREVGEHQLRGLVDLLCCGGGVFVDEQAAQFAQAL